MYMPDGEIEIALSGDFSITMTGAVTKVAEGVISEDIFI
jgi:diaminopimelate epimerase